MLVFNLIMNFNFNHMGLKYAAISNVLASGWPLPFRNSDLPGSNPGPITAILHETFQGFPQFMQEYAGIVP
jgi:hypothetical protein